MDFNAERYYHFLIWRAFHETKPDHHGLLPIKLLAECKVYYIKPAKLETENDGIDKLEILSSKIGKGRYQLQ